MGAVKTFTTRICQYALHQAIKECFKEVIKQLAYGNWSSWIKQTNIYKAFDRISRNQVAMFLECKSNDQGNFVDQKS